MRKFWVYFKMAVADAFVYRAEGIIWMLVEVSEPLVAIVFWLAAFQGRDSIAGYTLSSMVIYYFGVMFINNLVATHPQYQLSEKIRDGSFSNYLVKPVNLASAFMAGSGSWRVVRLILFLPPLLIIGLFLKLDFAGLDLSALRLLLVLASLVMAFWLHFFIKMIMGLTTIWFMEAGWLFLSFNIVKSFFGGDLIPLDLFPSSMLLVANWLPFKYLTYFPLRLGLNNLSSSQEIWLGLLVQFGWCVVFYLLYLLVLKRGAKNYSAYGG